MRIEVNERVDAAAGADDLTPALKDEELEAIAQRLEREGIDAIAILFLHSYRNPDHEIRARGVLHAPPAKREVL